MKRMGVGRARPGEITFKEWRHRVGRHLGVHETVVMNYVYTTGKIPRPRTLRKASPRKFFVRENEPMPKVNWLPAAGEYRLKEWLHAMAELRRTTPKAIYNQLIRGAFRGQVRLRRVNQRVVFVKEREVRL